MIKPISVHNFDKKIELINKLNIWYIIEGRKLLIFHDHRHGNCWYNVTKLSFADLTDYCAYILYPGYLFGSIKGHPKPYNRPPYYMETR